MPPALMIHCPKESRVFKVLVKLWILWKLFITLVATKAREWQQKPTMKMSVGKLGSGLVGN